MPKPSHRDRLLAAGLDSIHAHGYAATGVGEITQAAGVPKGSFYNHFSSKVAFGLAALEAYWRAGEPAMALLRAPGLPARERLVRHFRAVQTGIGAVGFERGCMLSNFAIEAVSAGEEIRAQVAELNAQWLAMLTNCIAEGAAAGEIRRDLAPADLGRFLFAAWQGCVQQAKVEPLPANVFEPFFRTLDRLLAP